jgi:hypothetical protein
MHINDTLKDTSNILIQENLFIFCICLSQNYIFLCIVRSFSLSLTFSIGHMKCKVSAFGQITIQFKFLLQDIVFLFRRKGCTFNGQHCVRLLKVRCSTITGCIALFQYKYRYFQVKIWSIEPGDLKSSSTG